MNDLSSQSPISERLLLLLVLAVPITALVLYGLSHQRHRDLHASTSSTSNELTRAVEADDLNRVKSLIDRGERVATGNYSAVDAAARQSPPTILKWLLDRGLDDRGKEAAMYVASAMHNVEA